MKTGDRFFLSANGGKNWVSAYVGKPVGVRIMVGIVHGRRNTEWMLSATADEMAQYEAGQEAKATWGNMSVLIKKA